MIDFKLSNNDIKIGSDGKVVLVEETKNVIQKIYIFLKIQAGEWFYNINIGVPWVEFLTQSDKGEIATIFLTDAFSNINGVKNVVYLNSKINTKRNMVISGVIEDVFGKGIKLEEEVE